MTNLSLRYKFKSVTCPPTSALSLAVVLVFASFADIVSAKTVTQWRQQINPGSLSLTCERSFNFGFARKVTAIALDKGIPVPVVDKKGIIGNLNEMVELMDSLRKAGFTITGPKGEERAGIKTKVRMTYKRSVTLSIKDIDRGGFNIAVSSKGGKGGVDQKKVTQYASADMQEKIKASYNEYKADMVNQAKSIRNALNNKRFKFKDGEIDKINNKKGGEIVRNITTPKFCDRAVDVTIKAIWEKFKQ